MEVYELKFYKDGGFWRTESLCCGGGDVRLRVHKNGPYPVDIMVSIDGCEEYLRHDDFGFDERMCEVTLEGVMPGQYIMLRSRSELTLVKYMEV